MKHLLRNYFGVACLTATLALTFVYSFWVRPNLLCADEFYYLQLVKDGDYSQPMVSGTVFFYKLFTPFLGDKSLWLWHKLNWLLMVLSVLLPYYALLEEKQRKLTGVVAAFSLLFVVDRTTIEPYPPTFFFDSLMLVSLFKYAKRQSTKWLYIVAVTSAMVVAVRFPNIVGWPFVMLSILLLGKKWKHLLLAVVISLLAFFILSVFTHGGITSYARAIVDNYKGMQQTDTNHTLSNLTLYYIHNAMRIVLYAVTLLGCYAFSTQKRSWGNVSVALSFAAVAAVFYLNYLWTIKRGNPYYITWEFSLLVCATAIVALAILIQQGKRNVKCWVLSLIVIIISFANCAGSDGGLSFSSITLACFLPVITASFSSIPKAKSSKLPHILLCGLIVAVVCIRLYIIGISVPGKHNLHLATASPQLMGVYTSDEEGQRILGVLNHFHRLPNEQKKNVVFWGTRSRIYYYNTGKRCPIDGFWMNDGNEAALKKLYEVVQETRPLVFSVEDSKLLPLFFKNKHYAEKKANGYTVYYPEREE